MTQLNLIPNAGLSGPRTVLVVDQNDSECRIIALLLETAGYRVLQASNGAQALRVLACDMPDIIITDIVMPEKDGIELIQAVRERPAAPAIVAMSGAPGADVYLYVARLLGARAVLKKPIMVDQLFHCLLDCL